MLTTAPRVSAFIVLIAGCYVISNAQFGAQMPSVENQIVGGKASTSSRNQGDTKSTTSRGDVSRGSSSPGRDPSDTASKDTLLTGASMPIIGTFTEAPKDSTGVSNKGAMKSSTSGQGTSNMPGTSKDNSNAIGTTSGMPRSMDMPGGMPGLLSTSGVKPGATRLTGGMPSSTGMTGGTPSGQRMTGGMPGGQGMSGVKPGATRSTGGMPTTFQPRKLTDMSPFQSILQKMKMGKKPEISKCEIEDVDVHCGELVGIFYKWEGYPFEQVLSKTNLPFRVSRGKKLLIAVCNFGNTKHMSNTNFPEDPLVPQLVENIGAKAKVQIQIQKSANVEIWADATFEPESYNPRSLIATLVSGNIDEEATVSIKLMDSANAKLMKKYKSLEMKGSRAISTLIKSTNNKCLKDVCVSIKAETSGNIMAKDIDGSEVKLRKAAINDPLFMANCTQNVTVRADVSQFACVMGAKELEMEDSCLMNPLISVGAANESRFLANIEESANTYLEEELEMKSSALFTNAFQNKYGEEIVAKAQIDGSANVFSKEVKMEKSRIIGAPIKARNSSKGILMTSVDNSGNVMTKESVLMWSDSKIIGCALKLDDGPFAVVSKAKVSMSGNIRASKLRMHDDCAVMGYAIESSNGNSSAFVADLNGVANIATSEGTEMMKSCIVGDLIKIEDAEGPFKAKLDAKYVANVLCGKGKGYYPMLKLRDSKLASSALEVSSQKKNQTAVKADVELRFVGNSFVKTEGAEKLVEDIFDQEKCGADQVSITQKSVGKMLNCELIKA